MNATDPAVLEAIRTEYVTGADRPTMRQLAERYRRRVCRRGCYSFWHEQSQNGNKRGGGGGCSCIAEGEPCLTRIYRVEERIRRLEERMAADNRTSTQPEA